MKQRLYIDTSVFGGYFDEEFAEFTRPLFTRLQNGEFRLGYNSINIKNGYKELEIRSPRDFMIYEDNN
jgi:hypothetical protein